MAYSRPKAYSSRQRQVYQTQGEDCGQDTDATTHFKKLAKLDRNCQQETTMNRNECHDERQKPGSGEQGAASHAGQDGKIFGKHCLRGVAFSSHYQAPCWGGVILPL